MTFFFTFPANSPNGRNYVRIEAENYWRAREAMICACGTQWCSQYTEAEFALERARYHLVEMRPGHLRPAEGAFGRRHRASYSVVKSTDEAVWIIDLDGDLSVTNDAERVVEELARHYGERRIVYRDSNGDWDELRHRGARFLGYAPAREMAVAL